MKAIVQERYGPPGEVLELRDIGAPTADDDGVQTYPFAEDVSGTLYVRVRDTDRTPGNRDLDTVSIDQLFLRAIP